jgi:excisionase family DNA binding protein
MLQIITDHEALDALIRVSIANAFKDLKLVQSESNQTTPEQEFSISELANYLKVTKATIHTYKKRKVFPFYQTGRTVYFKKSEVDKALQADKKKGVRNG